MASAAEYDFQDFVDTEHLPATFKVTSGYFGSESEEVDFATGEVYTAESVECSSVLLQLRNNETGRGEERKLSTDFILKFQIVCYDPERVNRVYRTVLEMRHVCPFLVQCGRDYKDPKNPSNNFNKGQLLRLMRFVNRDGEIELECRSVKGSTFKFLPMDCRGDFKSVCNTEQYTIKDLTEVFRRRCKLIIKLSDHPINTIHGHRLPVNQGEDIILLPPNFEVVLFKEDCPGSRETVPIAIPLTVSPRSHDYFSPLLVYYNFDKYITDNAFRLPFVLKIMDWSESSNLFECHGIRPGIRLHVFEMKTVTKVLAHCEDKFLSIPLSNETKYTITPEVITNVGELVDKGPRTVRVIKLCSQKYKHYLKKPLSVGQILRIPQSHTDIQMINGNEEETLCAEIFDESRNQFSSVYLPLFLDFTFEEIRSGGVITVSHVKNIDKPLKVTHLARDKLVSHAYDVLSDNEELVVCCFVEEDVVLASTDTNPSSSFHLPLHSGIQVSLDRDTTVLKKAPLLSPDDRCMHIITEARFRDMSATALYAYMNENAATPLISPIKSIGKTRRKPPSLPISRNEGQAPVIPPRKRSESSSGADSPLSPNPQPAVSRNTKTAVVKPTVKSNPIKGLPKAIKSLLPQRKEKSPDYYNCQGNPFFTFKKKDGSKVPDDGNLNSFSVDEMAKFLEAMSVSPRGVRAVYEHAIDGYRFGMMSDDDLAHLDMVDSAGVVKTFRDKTLRMRKAATLPVQSKK